MKSRGKKLRFSFLMVGLSLLVYSSLAVAEVKGAFLYNLSDFTGTIPYNWARVFVDEGKNEIYVLYANSITVFNENGMEIYRFGDDSDFGHIIDGAVDQSGNILLLTYQKSEPRIVLCNFRGDPISRMEMKNLPAEFSKFSPTRIVYRGGRIYLGDTNSARVIVTDEKGVFQDGYDLFPYLGLDEKERGDKQIIGFNVDKDGNILFTISVLFKAYIFSPDRKLTSFGQPGGSPGRFAVASGIVSDHKGNYLIVDKLKCLVAVFDKEFKFLTQFGYRGLNPGNLIAPDDIAIDGNDRIYVTQTRSRGVSVYRMEYN